MSGGGGGGSRSNHHHHRHHHHHNHNHHNNNNSNNANSTVSMGSHYHNGHTRPRQQEFVLTTYTTDESANINRMLPKELLLRIFSYLDVVTLCRSAQVSRYWNVLALDGSNWQRVNLFGFQTDVESVVVENLSKRCGGFLKTLSLRGCMSVTDHAMKTFALQCQNIEYLDMNQCRRLTDVGNMSDDKRLYQSRTLDHLVLRHVRQAGLCLQLPRALTCQSLGKYCSKLTHIDLDSCALITNSSLKALSEGCHGITSVNISWCSQIMDEGLEMLAMGCPKLTYLCCKGCTQLTDVGFHHIAHRCRNLRSLNMQSCINISDECIICISEGCPDLEALCVSKCNRLTDASIVALGQSCHNLRTLEVAGCSQFTDSGFQALTKNCHLLEKLDLEECTLITDATLGHLALQCAHLSNLTLSHCEMVTDEGIRHLGGGGCATEALTVLELDNCPLISDIALDHLMGCQSLQRIELYDCQLITRAGIRRLKNHLPGIKVHAYFAPATPPSSVGGSRQRYCRCCVIV